MNRLDSIINIIIYSAIFIALSGIFAYIGATLCRNRLWIEFALLCVLMMWAVWSLIVFAYCEIKYLYDGRKP